MTDTDRLPVYAVSHGGGPWPWIKDSFMGDWTQLERALQAVPAEVGTRPRAIVSVTAHWIGGQFTVGTAERPPMLYDYGGFPEHTYHVVYPAPGSPAVAEEVAGLLMGAGLPVQRDARRGFDHGTFVPLAVSYPEARIPVVQLSIRSDFDPAAHLAAGRALAPLRDDGVLLYCSGVPSFHNFSKMGPAGSAPSSDFDAWLRATVVDHVGADRSRRLEHWRSAPSAADCHPQPDHLLPLLVAAGAAEDDAGFLQYHEDRFMGVLAESGFRFGAAAAVPAA